MNIDLYQAANWAIIVLISFIFGMLGGFVAFKVSQRNERQRRLQEEAEDTTQDTGLPLPKIRDVIERTSGILDVEAVRGPSLKPASSKVRGYLYVLKGAEVAQEYFPILDKNMEIGRDEQCDISLDDTSVSRLHAMIFVRAEAVEIVDQASTNGTYINGKKITGIALLNENDQIQIGNSTFQYRTTLIDAIEAPKS
jgi:hypothetical protein